MSRHSGLLVALLGVADDRRRLRFCAGGCGHAWHHLRTGADTETATASCQPCRCTGAGQQRYESPSTYRRSRRRPAPG
ncbi:DUF5958 family protein [Streptomyces sp. NPDC048106]|uniref:DUF5958 family protein n=1 Tax=Streptomyces sp. NPDC048106 TaxID=3155750 RepID=UPI003453A6A3